jgi:hypothetical protein
MKTLRKLEFLLIFLAFSLLFVGAASAQTPTPTASPPVISTVGSFPIGINEAALLISMLIFLALAFYTQHPFLWSVSGFLVILFGLDVLLLYASDGSLWTFQIIGLIIMAFGAYVLVMGLESGLKDKGET